MRATPDGQGKGSLRQGVQWASSQLSLSLSHGLLTPSPDGSAAAPRARFLCGLFAGILAKLGTHPMDVAKKRFQVAGLARSTAYGARVDSAVTNSLWGCLRTVSIPPRHPPSAVLPTGRPS